MKVAIVHDHLAQDGGAERVVQVMMQMFPEAPLYTLVYNQKNANEFFKGRDIRTSFIQRWPGGRRFYQWYLPWMPTAIERLDLRGYDLVISSSASFAKGIITQPQTLHICYLHSPTRYLWSDTIEYVNELRYTKPLRSIAPFFLNRIRMWDRLAADRVDQFLANSKTVQHRIHKYYRRESQVLYPPVNVERFTLGTGDGGYYVTGGRLVPYKRFDLVVQAFNKLNVPLKIYGSGPTLKQLQRMAKPNIEFLGRVPDQALNQLYGQATAFINPQEEDFGITAVEAMATGRPVIAFAAGGARETVQTGSTGVFFQEQEWESLADAVIRFTPTEYDPAAIREWAERFSVPTFQRHLRQAIDQAWQKHQAQLP